MNPLYLLAAAIGYAFGCLNLAYFLARVRGFDIREKGSNNAGASNATITMGLKTGVAVGVHDIAKSCLAALLAGFLLPDLPYAAVVAGVAAVLGHIFPFYLRFRGGKGLASFLGLILALDWRFFLAAILVLLVITLVTDYIALGTFTAIVSFPAYLFLRHMGMILVALVSVASAVILWKHMENIRRLAAGKEIGLRRAMSKKDKV